MGIGTYYIIGKTCKEGNSMTHAVIIDWNSCDFWLEITKYYIDKVQHGDFSFNLLEYLFGKL